MKNRIIILHVTRACLPTLTFEQKIEVGEGASHTHIREGSWASGTSGVKGLNWSTPGLVRQHTGNMSFQLTTHNF